MRFLAKRNRLKYNRKSNLKIRLEKDSLKKIRKVGIKITPKEPNFRRRYTIERTNSFDRIAKLIAGNRKQLLLTVIAILIQLLVHLFHPFDIDAWALVVIHHRQRVLLADDALGSVLYTERRVPGLVNVPGREVLQHWQIASARGNKIDFILKQ